MIPLVVVPSFLSPTSARTFLLELHGSVLRKSSIETLVLQLSQHLPMLLPTLHPPPSAQVGYVQVSLSDSLRFVRDLIERSDALSTKSPEQRGVSGFAFSYADGIVIDYSHEKALLVKHIAVSSPSSDLMMAKAATPDCDTRFHDGKELSLFLQECGQVCNPRDERDHDLLSPQGGVLRRWKPLCTTPWSTEVRPESSKLKLDHPNQRRFT